MTQHPFFMEINSNYQRDEVGRAVANARAVKELPAFTSSAQLDNTHLVSRSVSPIEAVERFSRGFLSLVRGWTLALRGRAVA